MNTIYKKHNSKMNEDTAGNQFTTNLIRSLEVNIFIDFTTKVKHRRIKTMWKIVIAINITLKLISCIITVLQ